MTQAGSPPRAVGVDGVRGGWACAVRHVDGSVSWQVAASLRTVLDVLPPCVMAVDIPIGLTEAGARACDVAARRLLPGRTSSVFVAPTRATAQDRREDVPYEEAVRRARHRGHPAPSRQAWFITDKINDVADALLEADSARVVECHPEVSFAQMTGTVLPRKATGAGAGRRLLALRDWIDAPAVLATVPDGVPVVDALDALACLWTAERVAAGQAFAVGDADARIWV